MPNATPTMPNTIQLLVVEDSELDYELLLAILSRDQALTGLRVRAQRVEDEAGMRQAFAGGRIDAVVTDHNLPRFDSFAALKVAKSYDEDLPVLVLSGEMAEDLAVAVLHAGADDFILKARMFRLAPALRRSLQAAEVRRNARRQAQALAASEARLRELTQHLERVKEEERRRVAREIHDDIGSTLTALKFELARLTRVLENRSAAAPHINAMQELLAQAVAAADRIQHNLRPPVLDAGLVPALEWLIQGFRTRTGVAVSFETNREEIDLPAERATALYRAAQEALANVAKHAQAKRVSVHLFAAADEVSLEVADDGVGFDPAGVHNVPGFGVRGLIERAAGFGGWAEVNSAPGRGTTVMFSIPIGTPAAPQDGLPSTVASAPKMESSET
ncbi:MAG: histidine kinase [Sutterellaceae bacterium]|nr:histidine kinase [Burkholderiaceae bacterium]MCX7900966.1 histidine kinase [Burkholderiaceae bacterium]MDW8429992.1 histidine kinase [Sutterellaceae bacterium]